MELGCGPIPVIAVGSHDTASAVAAVPASGANVEVPRAVIDDKTFAYEFTNEGGVEKTIRLLKNIMGLWLIQECRRQWQREGAELTYDEITAMAEEARPFAGLLRVDDAMFLAPGDMPGRVNEYLARTGQKTTEDKGQVIRIILESLALRYREVAEHLEDATGRAIEVLHIVGGGIQNKLLCRFTASATGKKVVTGPIEATASGNILMQARATGQIQDLSQARAIVRRSFGLEEYQPQDTELWDLDRRT